MTSGLRLLLVLLLLAPRAALAQHYQSDCAPDEFRARWAKLFDRIGPDAIAIVQGAPLANGFVYPDKRTSSTTCAASRLRTATSCWMAARGR